jgi:hypothetical protein
MGSDAYYYRKLGRALGPYELRYMRQLAKKAQVNANSDVSTDGTQWLKGRDFPEIFAEPEVVGPKPELWHFTINGAQQTPVPLETLRQMVEAGQVSLTDMAWSESLQGEWRQISTYAELLPPGPPREDIEAKVRPPAYCLIGLYSLNILTSLFFLIVWLLVFVGAMAMPRGQFGGAVIMNEDAVAGIIFGVVGLVQNISALVFSGLCLFSAISMARLKRYRLSFAGAIISVIPCMAACGCYPISVGFGVWAIVILSRPEVREAFS